MATLRAGLTREISAVAREEDLASNVGSGLVSVFSTAMMIARMEQASVECVQDCLAPGQTTVGTRVDVRHRASTPVGARVYFRSELTEVWSGGKRLKFRVEAWDEKGLIGDGEHERAIIDKAEFERKTGEKLK